MEYLDKNKVIADVNFLDGVMIPIDKPLTWTSFDVVNKVRWLLKRKYNIKKIKVGHAGTLDPLATGLLILCTGKATKRIEEFQGQHKEYTGTIRLGETTPTYDSEMEADAFYPTDHINAENIENARKLFVGKIKQTPPIFSALKKNGVRAYKLAREGKEVKLNEREIEILSFDIDNTDLANLAFTVNCSKGTYIRSLAHDMGKALDSGAYLSSLVRTKIGEISIADAWNLRDLVEKLEEDIQKNNL